MTSDRRIASSVGAAVRAVQEKQHEARQEFGDLLRPGVTALLISHIGEDARRWTEPIIRRLFAMVEDGELNERSLRGTIVQMIRALQQNPRLLLGAGSPDHDVVARLRPSFKVVHSSTEVERKALRMFYLEKASLEEIAACTHLSPNECRRIMNTFQRSSSFIRQ
jgi:hypothetical protein